MNKFFFTLFVWNRTLFQTIWPENNLNHKFINRLVKLSGVERDNTEILLSREKAREEAQLEFNRLANQAQLVRETTLLERERLRDQVAQARETAQPERERQHNYVVLERDEASLSNWLYRFSSTTTDANVSYSIRYIRCC